MGNSNKNSKYFTIYLDKPYYYNNDEISGTIIINDINNIELIEGSLNLDLIENWRYTEGSGEYSAIYFLNNKINKKFLPINLKKIDNKDNYSNYKIPFNFKFFDLEPTIIINSENYIKTVLTFELLGLYNRNGKKDKKPKKEKYESFLIIKREPNYNKLNCPNFIEEDVNIYNSHSEYGYCKVKIKTDKIQFDVEEENPFEINIDNKSKLIGIKKFIFYILQIKENKNLNKTIKKTFKYKYDIKKDKIKILPGKKGWFKYKTKIDNNKIKNNFNVTANGNILTNNYFICVEIKFEKKCYKQEVKLPIFIGNNKQNINPMEFEILENNYSNNLNDIVNIDNYSNNNNNIQIKSEQIEKEINNDNMVYGFENINYVNN